VATTAELRKWQAKQRGKAHFRMGEKGKWGNGGKSHELAEKKK